MVFLKVVQVLGVSKLHVEKLFGFANSDELVLGLGDLLAQDCHLVDGVLDLRARSLRLVRSLLGSVFIPFLLNFFNVGIDVLFFFEDFSLESGDLFVHLVDSLLEDLLEGAPLALDDIDPEPVRWPLESLLLEELLPGFAPVQLVFPLGQQSLHLLDFSDEESDVIRVIKRQVFKFAPSILDHVLEVGHLLSQGRPKPVQDLLVQLVVLVVHFGLDGHVVDLDSAETFEVFTRVKRATSLSDLIEKLVPLVDVLTEHVVNMAELDVPQGLVGLPGVKVGLSIGEDLLQDAVSFPDVEGTIHLEQE